jgi:hypothetical protein
MTVPLGGGNEKRLGGHSVLFLYLYNGHRAKLPTAEAVTYRDGDVAFLDGSQTSIAEFRQDDIIIYSHQDLGTNLDDRLFPPREETT